MTTTIELAKQAGSTHKPSLGVYQFFTEELEAFRALIVADRDKELMGVGLKPVAWHYSVPMPDGQMFICASTKRLEFEFGVTPVEAGNVSEPLYTAEQFAAARLQDRAYYEGQLSLCEGTLQSRERNIEAMQQRIKELEATQYGSGRMEALRTRIAELEANLKRATAALAERNADAEDSAEDFLTWYENAMWGDEDFKAGCQRAWDAALAKRKPLTDEQILQIAVSSDAEDGGFWKSDDLKKFTRAIESAHGIKEPTCS